MLGLLLAAFWGVEFGLKGEAMIPLDRARIDPVFGFESRLSNSGSILELRFSTFYGAIHYFFTDFLIFNDFVYFQIVD